MMEEDNIIEIEDLAVGFHTRQGVVKALDGIGLSIRRGETFGLVGETGCGKSVTASSVMRLLPIPPAKVESGHIYFLRPNASEAEKAELARRIEELQRADANDDDAQLAALKQELEEWNSRSEVRARIATLRAKGVAEEDLQLAEAKKELERLDARYDLLSRSQEYMQTLRGKYISMIFQEPMSALNPVLTVGDQVSEIILRHESKAMCHKIAGDLADRMQQASLIADAEGRCCSACGAPAAENADSCPECGRHLDAKAAGTVAMLKLRALHRIYAKMADEPDAFLFRLSSKIPLLRRYRRPLEAEARNRTLVMLKKVRIPDQGLVADSYPFELSGGMQQRVMIAMALACNPRLLIADEPTTALDVTIQAQILKLMRDLQEEAGTTVLLITHNLGVVAEVCDRVGVMYAGTMAEVGATIDVFKEPLHPYTQGLIRSIPNMTGENIRLATIDGNVPDLTDPPSGCRFHPRCPFAMNVCREKKPALCERRKDHSVACHLYPEVR